MFQELYGGVAVAKLMIQSLQLVRTGDECNTVVEGYKARLWPQQVTPPARVGE
jgi:hypothetical protein